MPRRPAGGGSRGGSRGEGKEGKGKEGTGKEGKGKKREGTKGEGEGEEGKQRRFQESPCAGQRVCWCLDAQRATPELAPTFQLDLAAASS